MKKLLFMIPLLAAGQLFAQNKNFSGEYKLNESRVNWNGLPKFALPLKFSVTQQADQLTIARTTYTNMDATADTTNHETYLFNGTPRKVTSGGTKTEAVLHWNPDQATFYLDKKIVTENDASFMGIKEDWSLEDGGKTLRVVREVASDRGGYSVTGYFDRQ